MCVMTADHFNILSHMGHVRVTPPGFMHERHCARNP
jgi:hypothetical protein